MATARLRMNRVALLPVLFLVVCVLPLASAASWTLVFLLVPVLVAAWVLRTGVDVGDDGVTVRSMTAARHVAWNEVAGIRVADRGDLWLVTTRGTELQLPTLRARDLPRLAAVYGGRIPAPGPA